MKPECQPVSEMKLPTGITPEMAQLIVPGDPADPIALQFLPDAREEIILPQELYDPTGDYPHAPMKALVHRHANRVLLKPTMVCAVYCRFCFRRDMVGPEGDTITQSDVDQALEYIAAHTEINEVILTGGDPLVLSPKRVADLMQKLQAIPHIRWIRFHTRIPVVAPDKISAEMLDALKGIKPVLMAVHVNHAREITPKAGAALARLAHNGVVLLGQSVLLKGINDKVETLAELFETLMVNRVKPYYLHHPDLTAGTSHFRMSFEEGMALMNKLQQRVSGVCMPQYVIDIPGGVTKIAITPDNVQAVEGKPGHYVLHDPMGGKHNYSDIIPKA
jgi:lysine 2,3-aminomutase